MMFGSVQWLPEATPLTGAQVGARTQYTGLYQSLFLSCLLRLQPLLISAQELRHGGRSCLVPPQLGTHTSANASVLLLCVCP